MSEPICKITKLGHPNTMPVEDLQITIEYDNIGAAGPTFYRVRKPGTWAFKLMADTLNHVPGDLKGGHGYHTVPKGHLILQVEVGHGTWQNPIKITDTKMIIILHPEYPPPDTDDTQVIIDLATPPKMWAVTKHLWAAPGSTIMASWVYDNRDGEHSWKLKYQRHMDHIDPNVVPVDWVVNGVPWPEPSTFFDIGPGETHVLEVKAEIPDDYEAKFVSFAVYPINPMLVV